MRDQPEGYLFCSTLLPLFIAASAPQWPQYAAIGVVFAALDFVVMFGHAAVGAHAMRLPHRVRDVVARPLLWRRVAAALSPQRHVNPVNPQR